MAGLASLSQDQLLDRIAERLEWERTRQPAFTLLLGSGFSAPLIPTAGQVVARDIAWWLYWRRRAREGELFEPRPSPDTDDVLSFERDLWTSVCAECPGNFELQDGLPATSAENVGGAYRAIMSGMASRGLSDPQRRRRYLRDLCARIGKRVNGAHIFLANILRAQEPWAPDQPWKRPFCRTIFTTNFDPLLQRSLQLVSRLYFMSDRPEALEPPEDEDQDAIHLVYSHGSVHRYLLLNTAEEIESARARNASALVPYLQRHGVLVIGYSGWLDATMQALSNCTSFDGNLFWCDVYRPEEAAKRLSVAARELLASKAGYAFYVPIAGADELMLALHRRLGLGDAPGFIRDPIGQMIEDLVSVEVPDTREPANQPRAIDTLKDSRDRTVTRLHAALRVFENPEQVQGGGERQVTAADQRVYDHAVTAKLMGEALEKAEAGDLDRAIEIWTNVSDDERAPADVRAQALINRGAIYGRQSHWDLASADFGAVVASPDAPAEQRAWALFDLAFTRGQQDRPDDEIQGYTDVIAMPEAPATQRAWARVNRGSRYLGRHLVDEAMADFSAVIAMPDAPADQRAKAFFNLAYTSGQQDQMAQAIAYYDALIAMTDCPADLRAEALVNRGAAHRKEGQQDQAMADFTAVIALPAVAAKQRALALLNRADIYGDQGRMEQAIADCTALIALSDAPTARKAEALGKRAWFRFISQPPDLTGLREDSEAALAIAPHLTGARFNLGLALLLAGEAPAAVTEYTRAAQEGDAALVRGSREDLERATADKQVPGAKEILNLLEAREAELAARAAQPPAAPAGGSA
jgi:tetratricopeptide (TPR) repeat protein